MSVVLISWVAILLNIFEKKYKKHKKVFLYLAARAKGAAANSPVCDLRLAIGRVVQSKKNVLLLRVKKRYNWNN